MGEEEFRARNLAFHRELRELDFPSHQGEIVIEVGCGTGFEPISYAMCGAYAVGLDMSLESLELARKRASALRVSPEWVIGDAENEPFRDNAFDFVSSLGVLHHTPDTKKAVAEVHRILKENGRTVIMLYNRSSLSVRYLRWKGVSPEKVRDQGCPIVKFYDREAIRNLFEIFRSVRIRAYGLPRLFKRNNIVYFLASMLIEPYFGWGHYIKAMK